MDSVDPLERPHGGEPRETVARARFDAVAPFTLGIEEELLLVDATSYRAAPAAGYALAAAGDARLAREMRAAQVELVTPVCATVAEASCELGALRRRLADALAGAGVLVLGVGAHPLDRDPGEVSDTLRHRSLAAEHPWAARHVLACGLHVHVAVSGADRALAVHDALRSYLPELLALGANAPFYGAADSGLATVRPKLNQAWPRSGVPPAFGSWRELAEFDAWARAGGAFPDGSYRWWDLRLNERHGTIEVRVADAQTRVEDAATVAALVQSLVVELAGRHDAGERLPVHPGERIAENAWLATRDGLRGHLIDLETGVRVPAVERLGELAERLLPVARSLGCERELHRCWRLLAEGGGAGRQRRIVEERGLGELAAALAAETAGGARDRAGESPRAILTEL